MRMLGHDLPPYDFKLPSVTSMTADPHKLGLTPRPSGAIILRDISYFEKAVPIEDVLIDTLVASGRPGGATAAVWALIQHLGKRGYMELVKHMIELTKMLTDGIRNIEGLRLLRETQCNIIVFTSETYDIKKIHQKLLSKGWAISLDPFISYNIQFIRIYVHPLKERGSAESLLKDLEEAVRAVRLNEN